jgi:hypothetical protein
MGGHVSDNNHLRTGHIEKCQSNYIHVEHAICLQHSLQDQVAIYNCHE